MVAALVLACCLSRYPALDALAKRYGVEVEVLQQPLTWKGAGYVVKADPPDVEVMGRYIPTFVKEWSLYPPAIARRTQLHRIVFGAHLSVDGQLRAAVPAFDGYTMYYDPERGSTSLHYQRIVVHHEFFHMMDQRMDLLGDDVEWSKLNGLDFHYGPGGSKMQTGPVGQLTDKLPGFLTPYSTAAVEEDKAELFAHAVVDWPFVADRIKIDPVLKSKFELLKSRLSAFEDGMGEGFWRRIAGSQPPGAEFAPTAARN